MKRLFFLLGGLLLGVICCAGGLRLIWSGIQPVSGVNQDAEDVPISLPKGAKRVSYYCDTINVAFECEVSEREFLRWAPDAGALETRGAYELVEGPCDFPERYCEFLPNPCEVSYEGIDDGWSAEWSKEDRGLYLAYDRKTHRMYYFSHSR